jgi:predicted dehydrogenase
MASGAQVQIWMTYETPAPGMASSWEFVIVGATGILRLDPYGTLLLGRGDGWETAGRQEPFDPLDANDPIRLRAYARQLEDLVASARDGRDPLVSGEEGRRTTAMLDAAEVSARTGRAVHLAAPA